MHVQGVFACRFLIAVVAMRTLSGQAFSACSRLSEIREIPMSELRMHASLLSALCFRRGLPRCVVLYGVLERRDPLKRQRLLTAAGFR